MSSKANIIRTKAIVLRRTNYGEVDRIVQVITPEHGHMSIMARSVRKERSRLAGGIELFSICDIVVRHGKGDMFTLTGAKLDKFHDKIMIDYNRLQFGYEAIKQVANASGMINEPDFFDLLSIVLESLNDHNIPLVTIKAWFYLRLADALGNGLNVLTDNSGMKLLEDARYNFDFSDQVFVFSDVGKYGSDHIKLLRVMTMNPPSIFAKIIDSDKLIDDCLKLTLAVAKI